MKKIFLSFAKLNFQQQQRLAQKILKLRLNCPVVISGSLIYPKTSELLTNTSFLSTRSIQENTNWNLYFDLLLYRQCIEPFSYLIYPIADRYRPSNVGFHYVQTKCQRIFTVLHHLLLKHSPTEIIFSKEPETDVEIILACMCKYLDIQTIYSRFGLFDHSRFLSYSWDAPALLDPLTLHPNTLSVSSSNNIINPITASRVKAIQSASDNYVPSSELSRLNGLSLKSHVIHILGRLLNLKKLARIIRGRSHELEGSALKFILLNSYSSYTTTFDFDSHSSGLIIYLPLHYQPEVTTMPRADYYSNQLTLAKNLSDQLPDDSIILIKEHIANFSPLVFLSSRFRSVDFYKLLSSIPKVVLCSLNTSSILLQRKSDIIATSTGTAGLEGLLHHKKILVFGNASYLNAPNTYHIKSSYDIKNAISQPLVVNNVSDSINQYLSTFDSCCLHLNSPLSPDPKLRSYEFTDHLLLCLIKSLEFSSND